VIGNGPSRIASPSGEASLVNPDVLIIVLVFIALLGVVC